MDNQNDNSVFKEEDAKLRDETSDGRKSEREIESDDQQDKAIRNGASLHKPQEETTTETTTEVTVDDSDEDDDLEDDDLGDDEDVDEDDDDDTESVEDTDDEETEDAKEKRKGTGL